MTELEAPGAPIEGPAVYFDGRSAQRREAIVRLGEALEIGLNGVVAAQWPYADIRRADSGAGVMGLACLSAPELARLNLRDEALKAAVERRCTQLGQRDIDRRGVAKIIFWSLAAAASLIAVAVFGVPRAADGLTRLVSPTLERRLGDAIANQVNLIFGDKKCINANGNAALAELVQKLAVQAGLPGPLPLTVIDTNMANAFALPGGRVYVLRGLIDKAHNSDELAGVLAHELGHVAHRDGLRVMISSGGSAFLLGLLLGDVSGSGAIILGGRALMQSAHSREAEASADAFAAMTLHGLGRTAAPLGVFLLRLTGNQEGQIALLASHPLSQDRLVALQKDDAPSTGPDILGVEQWRAIKQICKSAPL